MPLVPIDDAATLAAMFELLLERVRAIALGQSARFFGVLSEGERAELLRMLMKLYEAHVAPLPSTVPRA